MMTKKSLMKKNPCSLTEADFAKQKAPKRVPDVEFVKLC